jgi:hypothetical protein
MATTLEAGKLIQPSAPYQVVASWIEAADRDFKRHSVAQGDEKDAWKKSWVKEYGKSEDWAFEGALVTRLVRAGCKAVSERGMNEKAMSDVRGLVSLLRKQRNEFTVSCVIERDTDAWESLLHGIIGYMRKGRVIVPPVVHSCCLCTY